VVTITVHPALTGGTVETDQSVCSGEDVDAFTSSAPAAGGSGSITYTWLYSTTGSVPGTGTWTSIPSSDTETWDNGALAQTTYFVRMAEDALCGTVYSNVVTVTVDTPPSVNAGPDAIICYNSTAFQILSASVTGSSSFLWNTPDGSGYFDDNSLTDPVYTIGNGDLKIGKGGDVHFVISAAGQGACSGTTVTDTMTLTIAPELIASVGAPSPFLIGPDTKIDVNIKIEDRYILNDLGFYLVSPDDSVVVLKLSDSPLSYCN
jgi:hypothetical protein